MEITNGRPPLELWGGTECTINRVGDAFLSQLERNGHRARLEDLDAFAELGLRRLRFPILWEELAPDSLDCIDWRPIDGQLRRMQELGIAPIAGLVHHGSGPAYTSLIDPEFPVKLAAFARQVVERYPWIDAYTPVNEPLTTARFSGLYGHWYPHGRDSFTFARALLNQCRAVALAMRAIREINPSALLVQTDDLGKTYSRPALRYQAEFENERRWITWDLLSGRVNRDHALWSYFDWVGIDLDQLRIFQNEPCPADIIGINHYITSERFLDDNLRGHPPGAHGGNGRDRYADVAAVRVREEGTGGPKEILREACLRYRLPVAVTEAHLGCTREEQLRWFMELWEAAESLGAEGFEVRAVTAWSLLGAFDWNSLLTRRDGHYEPGAFDLRGDAPRPTAVARMLRELAHGRGFHHPTLTARGWWHRPVRLIGAAAQGITERIAEREQCPVREASCAIPIDGAAPPPPASRPILIAGGEGRLAGGFAAAAHLRGLPCRLLSRSALDITSASALDEAIGTLAPWAIINCAGFAEVDAAERQETACFRDNVEGAETLARACAIAGLPLLTFSSDHVFGGAGRTPLTERALPAPQNVYGESKVLAERKVALAHPAALIIRGGKLLTAASERDFLRRHLHTLARGEQVRVPDDIELSISYLPDLVHAALDLLLDDEHGIWHLANPGVFTPEALLREAAHLAQLDTQLIEGVPAWSLNRPALRPRFRALQSERGELLPPPPDALHRYVCEWLPMREAMARLAAAL